MDAFNTVRPLARWCARRCTLVLVLLMIPLITASAQSGDLDRAKTAYQNGEFDQAAELFSEVYRSPAAARDDKKEALHYLGRAYIAQNEYEEAKRAVADLLELEPPMVELDPDIEPPPLMNIYYDVRKDLEGYRVQKRDPGMQTLAIMDFTNSSVDDHDRLEPLEQGFASMMINYLNGTTELKVVERERIQWLLDELDMQRDPELIDQSTAVRTGKLMGANAVLFGAYTMQGNQMWISTRMVDVETGEILLAEQVFGDSDQFFETIKDLSLEVAQAINVTLEETEVGARTETQSLDAMLAYSEGLKLLEQREYRTAHEKFNEALSYDPNYKKAELKLQSLTPMLAVR